MTTSTSLPMSALAFLGAATLSSSLALTACRGDEFQACQPAECGGGGDGGGDGTGGTGDAGHGGDGGAGSLVPGTQYIPGPTRPGLSATLTPARAFLSWQPGAIPAGKALAGYDVCWTKGAFSLIDDFSECPNQTAASANHLALDNLAADSDYYWKVLALYDDGMHSDYSVPRLFKTDHSLSAWWKLDQGTGDVAVDASLLGNDGALTNAPQWTPGFLGQALLFGGTRHVSVASAPSLNFGTGDFSLSAWVYSNATGPHQGIINKGTYSLYKQDSGRLSFFTPGCGIIASAGDITPSTWHHVMALRAGSTLSLYLDGQLTGAGTCTDALSGVAQFILGCEAAACAEPFDGVIDDVIVTKAGKPDAVNDVCAARALAGAETGTLCQ